MKKLLMSFVFIFALIFTGLYSEADVDAKTYTTKYGKTKRVYYRKGNGKKPLVTSSWTTRKTTNYKNYRAKIANRTKYTLEMRNKSKKYTYKSVRSYYTGGRKTKDLKIYNKYAKTGKSYTNRYYRNAKYNTKGKLYYDYTWTKHSNGKIANKTVLSNGVKKKYNYNTSGTHMTTYKWQSGKWVKIWERITESGNSNNNNAAYPSDAYVNERVAFWKKIEGNMDFKIVFQAKSSSKSDKDKADKMLQDVLYNQATLEVGVWGGYNGYPISMSGSSTTGAVAVWYDNSDGKEKIRELAQWYNKKYGYVVKDNVVFVK